MILYDFTHPNCETECNRLPIRRWGITEAAWNGINVHVLMRDERKKQAARSNKQTRQSNTAHPRQSLFLEKMSCLGWDSNPCTCTCVGAYRMAVGTCTCVGAYRMTAHTCTCAGAYRMAAHTCTCAGAYRMTAQTCTCVGAYRMTIAAQTTVVHLHLTLHTALNCTKNSNKTYNCAKNSNMT